ncbi:SLC7A5 [Branchiostoma lanceolatum]|uniref:SLC7A5 protein n=1 Tax=Branchiostoma lanceolatum TaxID=7740 RepID=A0A8K0EFE0_BRALA|nr:SLC7A5 [Branchiostoma lanceolatum]
MLIPDDVYKVLNLTGFASWLSLAVLFGLLMLIPGDVYKVLNLMGFASWLSLAVTVIGLLWWRYKKPDLPRPIKVNIIIPVLFVLLSMFMVVVSFVSAPVECGMGLAILASAVLVYAVFVHWESKPAWFLSFEVECGMGLVILASAVPVYAVFVHWENKPAWFLSFEESGMGLVILASAVPVYAVFVHWENKPAWFLSFEG